MAEQEFLQELEKVKSTIDNVCYLYNKNHSRKDLMQEIILELWKSRNSFKKNSTFKSWAYRIAVNVCVSALRKQQKQPCTEAIDNYVNVFMHVDNSNELCKQMHDAKRYNSVLSSIEEPYRTLFHKRTYGASFKDLEVESGIKECALRVKLHRIKKQLRAQFCHATK